MGEITINFDGICTHIKEIPSTFAVAAPHRVVLVHAEQGYVIADKVIPAHVATLEVPFERVIGQPELASMTPLGGSLVWRLAGTQIYVANAVADSATAGPIEYDGSYHNVPRLKEHNPELAPLNAGVVAGGDAAAYFDVHFGTFSSQPIHHGAWRSILKVQTDGDPELRIVPLIEGIEQPPLRLTSGATITIANTGDKRVKDSVFDFFLHYLTTEKMPPHPYYPPPAQDAPMDVLGPGCSNSAYP